MNMPRFLMAGVVLVIGLAGDGQPAFAADIAAGQEKASLCAACHGSQGISTMPLVPSLAGQQPAYLAKALQAYKDGSRKDAMMSTVASGLSDADIENLAAYFASLK